MRYIGWVLFCYGLLNYVGGVGFLFEKGGLSLNEVFDLQTMSIISIGVGGYLIKNFTEKK